MCGICGAIGNENQISTVVAGLKKLDYRGYDSSGVAYLQTPQNQLCVQKSVGSVKNLQKKLEKNAFSNVVIGHTRWATHGNVCEKNAHPHVSSSGRFAIVHNGIVENFESLKQRMSCDFYSDTDTEVFVNLIENQTGNTLQKLQKASTLIKGSFAVALLEVGIDKIFLAKRSSPLMVAFDHRGCVAASDISAFAGRFDCCWILNDNEFAVLEKDKVTFFDQKLKKISIKPIKIDEYDFAEENLQEDSFMLKEIKEQPVVLRNTYFKYFAEIQNLDWEKLKKFHAFHFVACGTAYHSCLMGARFLKQFCKKNATCDIASEFRYDNNIFVKNCLYIFVSQSGETADTIACANLVKQKGLPTMCVTNVPYCTLNNLADYVLPTFAGKEIAVASTKAYTAQVFTLLVFALRLANLDCQEILKKFVLNLQTTQDLDSVFKQIEKFKKIFFVGREQDFVTALEGALKLKEIAYIGCIGIAAGELKHGTLALVDDETLIVAISTQKSLKEKMESNMLEIKARGGKILLVSQFKHDIDVDFLIKLPDFEEFLMPIVSIIPLQHLALHFCQSLGYNPDKPRNLAKSVTVE